VHEYGTVLCGRQGAWPFLSCVFANECRFKTCARKTKHRMLLGLDIESEWHASNELVYIKP